MKTASLPSWTSAITVATAERTRSGRGAAAGSIGTTGRRQKTAATAAAAIEASGIAAVKDPKRPAAIPKTAMAVTAATARATVARTAVADVLVVVAVKPGMAVMAAPPAGPPRSKSRRPPGAGTRPPHRAAGDLADEGEAQAGAGGRGRARGRPVEGRKDPLALVLGHAGPAVADPQPDAALALLHARLDGRTAVAHRVLEQVAHQPPQQAGVAAHDRRLAGRLRLGPRGLLGRETEQVHLLAPVELLRGLQATGQEQLGDEVVQLGDVARYPVAQVRPLRPIELQRHADAGQRRAQLVRRAGQQRPLRAYQGRDAVRRPVEAGGQDRHLVLPLHGHARGQVACSPALDPGAQALQPSRQRRATG
jgi:hypothetical protein